MKNKNYFPIIATIIFVAGCGSPSEETSAPESVAPDSDVTAAPAPESAPVQTAAATSTVTIAPGPDVQEILQEALIEAEPGTTIQLEEGTYDFILGLSLDVDNVTLRGRGMDKTILDFKNQEAGSEGVFVTSDDVLLEDFAIIDTKGNAMKSHGTNNIVIRRVRTEWTGGPKETNGAYGLYPVSGQNTLIDGCVAIGASDAGIYVGQTKHTIIRNCRAEFNVAGIEIENCHFAEAYGNIATNNTGGILVFDLPDLPQQRGHDIRVYDNKVFGNNTKNFAPAGNIVAGVAAGSGIQVMANSNVEIFNNDIRDNDTFGVVVASYFASGNDVKDPDYYPYAEGVHIHHNTFGPSGTAPKGAIGKLVGMILGGTITDIVWDGIYNPEKMKDGKLAEEARIVMHDNVKENGEITFADLRGATASADPMEAKVNRDIAAFTGELPPVNPVVLEGTD